MCLHCDFLKVSLLMVNCLYCKINKTHAHIVFIQKIMVYQRALNNIQVQVNHIVQRYRQ